MFIHIIFFTPKNTFVISYVFIHFTKAVDTSHTRRVVYLLRTTALTLARLTLCALQAARSDILAHAIRRSRYNFNIQVQANVTSNSKLAYLHKIIHGSLF